VNNLRWWGTKTKIGIKKYRAKDFRGLRPLTVNRDSKGIRNFSKITTKGPQWPADYGNTRAKGRESKHRKKWEKTRKRCGQFKTKERVAKKTIHKSTKELQSSTSRSHRSRRVKNATSGPPQIRLEPHKQLKERFLPCTTRQWSPHGGIKGPHLRLSPSGEGKGGGEGNRLVTK